MTNIFCKVFRTVLATTPKDLLAIVTLLAKRSAPTHKGVDLGIGDAAIIKVLSEAYAYAMELVVSAKPLYFYRVDCRFLGIEGKSCTGAVLEF